MKNKKVLSHGFTLVELIVVITILAILGTIGFINLQSFGPNARDSARISDMKNIEKSLRFYSTQYGKYPLPDEATQISYSGSLVWTQGIFGGGLVSTLQRINKVPTDPLSGDFYAYSVLNTNTEFQIAGVLEGGLAYGPSVIQEAYAEGRQGLAYVGGDYNRKIARSSSGNTTYILAVPTIISGDISLTDIETLFNQKKLVYNNQPAIPASYDAGEFDNSEVFDFESSRLLVFSGSLDELENLAQQVDFIENLKEAYSGTIVESLDKEIKEITEITIDENDPSTDVKKIAHTLLKNSVSDKVPNFTNIPNPVTTPVVLGPCNLSAQDVIDLNDFFDYSGSTYQFNTEQEWCDLKVININSKPIGKTLPGAIGNLEKLTWLSINNSGVTGQLPSGLGNNMTNLTYFSMYKNDISGSIPSSYGNLPKLTLMRLYDNNLTGSIPPELGNIATLKTLELQTNGLTGAIPSNLGNLSNLEFLSLKENDLSGLIPESFSALNSLVTVNLSYNSFIGSLPTNIGDITSLAQLYLEYNDIDQLSDSMVNLSNLTLLNLNGNTQLGNLDNSFISSSSGPSGSQINITQTGKEMTILGNGTTIDITTN